MIKAHWEAFVPVMTSAQQQPLNLEEFKQLFTICYCQSNCKLRAAEEATVGHWETVLRLIGGKYEKMRVNYIKTLVVLAQLSMIKVFQVVL